MAEAGSRYRRWDQGGTIIGLVLGMLAWYIGAAKGPGNPYGVAAATVSDCCLLSPHRKAFCILGLESLVTLGGMFRW
jgi:hypothetical protein